MRFYIAIYCCIIIGKCSINNILKNIGELAEVSSKEGKNIYYYISDDRIKELIQLGQSIAEGSINNICTYEVIGNEKNEFREGNIDNGKRNFE